MKPRLTSGVVGILMMIVALAIGFAPLEVQTSTLGGAVTCGSAFQPDLERVARQEALSIGRDPRLRDVFVPGWTDRCTGRLHAVQTIQIVLFVLGVAGVLLYCALAWRANVKEANNGRT
jgi:hypothetical protein